MIEFYKLNDLNNYQLFLDKLNSDDNLYNIQNKEIEEEFEKTKNERSNSEVFNKKLITINKKLYNHKFNIFYEPSFISFLSWKDIHSNFDKLINKNLKYDIIFNINLIIGVKTGGHYLAYYLKNFINQKLNKNINITSCKIKRLIEDKTNINDEIIFDNHDFLKKELENKDIKILIMDDIVRHGYTMMNIINNLTTNYNIKKENIYTFSIFDSHLYHTSFSFNEFYPNADFIRLFCAPWGFDT